MIDDYLPPFISYHAWLKILHPIHPVINHDPCVGSRSENPWLLLLRSVYIQQKSLFNGLLIASTQRRPVPRERLSAVQADGVTPYEGTERSQRIVVAVNQRMYG